MAITHTGGFESGIFLAPPTGRVSISTVTGSYSSAMWYASMVAPSVSRSATLIKKVVDRLAFLECRGDGQKTLRITFVKGT